MILTKTDFKEYLLCPKCLWVKKKKPELYKEGEISLFLKKLIKDGYEVEEYVQKFFPTGVFVSGNNDELVEKTKELLKGDRTIFQATFQTNEGLFVKLDILKLNEETKKWDIYEVKASSEIKTDLLHNHIKDITFQSIVAEKSGVNIGDSYIVYINKKYVREGEIDPNKLFIFENVTEQVNDHKEIVEREIDQALSLLKREDVSLNECECLYRSAGQQCDCFQLFNPDVPQYSVHNIFRGNKLRLLVDNDVFDIKDIPEDFDLTDTQKDKVLLQKTGKPMIDQSSIDKTISNLQYPIYFLDYETLGSPIPPLDGYKANQNLVFQYSLHKLNEDGSLEHFEYLADNLEDATSELLESMKKNIGPVGSILVWFEPFEKGRNKELMDLHPEHKKFLEDVNNRIFDLMKVFKKDYLHPDFQGSASIKKVLPVMVPELSYKTLEIQDGTMALSEWEKMVNHNISPEEREATRKNLLEYCKLDTLAMVELFRKVSNFSKKILAENYLKKKS